LFAGAAADAVQDGQLFAGAAADPSRRASCAPGPGELVAAGRGCWDPRSLIQEQEARR